MHGSTRSKILALASLLVTMSACGAFSGVDEDETSSTGSKKSSAHAVPASAESFPGAPTAPTDPAACAAQAVALQAVIDKDNLANGGKHGTTGVLAVETPGCGKQILVAASPTQHPIDATSLHRVGDVTKTFVSLLVLKLANANKLTLEDTLQKWQPNLGVPNAGKITIRMLLEQTSGLSDYMNSDVFQDDSSLASSFTPEQLVAMAVSMGSYGSPGQGFHDAWTNYVLLGLVAMSAGGSSSLSGLLHSYVLGPANLTSTFFAGEDTLTGTLARGYDEDGNDLTNAENPSVGWAAGAMISSPSDLLDWVTNLYGGTLVDQATLTTLLAAPGVSVGDSSKTTYGLGVYEYPASSTIAAGQSLGHDGWVLGYSSMAAYFPSAKTAILVLYDADDEDVSPTINDAAAALFP